MDTRKVILVLAVSPKDVAAELRHLESVIQDVNRGMARERDLSLDLRRWETDARPGFHPKGPQGAIDQIFHIEDCDLVIGIFWTRIGTPIPAMGGETGTQHEINAAIRAWKSNGKPEIMLYFNQAAAPPMQSRQVAQVLDYRESLPKEGFYWDYSGAEDFKEKVRSHIEEYIRENWSLRRFEQDDTANASPGRDRKASVSRTVGDRRDRMFPSLPTAEFEKPELMMLGGAMTADYRNVPIPEDQDDGEENTGISAGYTYLGQFIYNDLTFDPFSSSQSHIDPAMPSADSNPRFDLSCIYGSGPRHQPFLYHSDSQHMLLGDTLTGTRAGSRARSVPRNQPGGGGPARALIADPRNDENVILSQLHSALLSFHNRIVDLLGVKFEEAQRIVRFHYQWVVLHDFLPRIVGKEMLGSILPSLGKGTSVLQDRPVLKFYQPGGEAHFPVEFSIAAFRFGHSMVRPSYRLNRRVDRMPIFPQIENSLVGFRALPRNWGIDWDLFFDMSADAPKYGVERVQPAYKIDTSLVNMAGNLPRSITSNPLSLAARNLLRGWRVGLPSGQVVARAMGLRPIADDHLTVGPATEIHIPTNIPLIKVSTSFRNNAPLWYYILAEAQQQFVNDATPIRLGPVGGRIVGEVFVGLMFADSYSFLRQDPLFRPAPELCSVAGEFTMADLLKQSTMS